MARRAHHLTPHSAVAADQLWSHTQQLCRPQPLPHHYLPSQPIAMGQSMTLPCPGAATPDPVHLFTLHSVFQSRPFSSPRAEHFGLLPRAAPDPAQQVPGGHGQITVLCFSSSSSSGKRGELDESRDPSSIHTLQGQAWTWPATLPF